MNAVTWPIVLLLPACLFASWSDLFRRTIPNAVCALTAGLGLCVALLAGGLAGLGSNAVHMVVALGVGMVLFRFAIVGGGDAKFYAACASWFAFAEAPRLLLLVSLSGLGLFVVWFVTRRIMRKPIRAKSESNFDRLPYGIAIGTGTLIAALA